MKIKLQQSIIEELGVILKEEFKLNLNNKDLEKLAYCILGYFEIVLKTYKSEEVRK